MARALAFLSQKKKEELEKVARLEHVLGLVKMLITEFSAPQTLVSEKGNVNMFGTSEEAEDICINMMVNMEVGEGAKPDVSRLIRQLEDVSWRRNYLSSYSTVLIY